MLSFRDLRVDLATGRAERNGHALYLTAKEHSLLVYLLRHAGQVLSRTRIYEHVWDERYDGFSNTLEVHVKELRRKLEAHGERLIHTLRGRGYLLGDSPEPHEGEGRMSLAARVSGFFLATLALVLAGVSVTLYLLTSAHLHRDLDERLGLALDSLATSVDVDPGRVEWNPSGRSLLVVHPDDEPVLWLVTDGEGATVDQTWEMDPSDLAAVAKLAPRSGHSHETFSDMSRSSLAACHEANSRLADGEVASNRRERQRADEPRSLVLSTAESLAPTEGALQECWPGSGRSLDRVLASGGGCGLVVVQAGTVAGDADGESRRFACRWLHGDQRLPIPGTGDELDLLAGSFNGLLDRLHQEFERQKRFTGDASHQLRTPLAALLGQLEVARRRERTVEEYQRVLEEAHGEAIRLRQIVDSLLFMARAESEAGSPELEPIELVLWVRERLASRHLMVSGPKTFTRGLTTEAPAVGAGAAAASGPVAGQLAGQRLQVQFAGDADHGRGGPRGRIRDAGGAGPKASGSMPWTCRTLRAVLSLGESAPAAGCGAGPGGCRADCARIWRNDERRETRGEEAGLSSGFRMRHRRLSLQTVCSRRWMR